MTKSESDNLKEEIHAPVKYFESKSACWDVDISRLSKAELILIVDKLPQRGKRAGVMSLGSKGDVVFISNDGQDMFFHRNDIGDMWSFVHKRLLLVVAVANNRNSHDLHFFSMHRRRGVDLVFKLRRMVSDERLDMMRMVKNQERVTAQLAMLQDNFHKTEDCLKTEEQFSSQSQESSLMKENFVDTESKYSETSAGFLSPPRSSSPQSGIDLLLPRTSSLPASSSQSSPDSGSSWYDILSTLRLEPTPPPSSEAFCFLLQDEKHKTKATNSSSTSCRNPFRDMDENSAAYEITNPFILSAVQNCFKPANSPIAHSHCIRVR